MKFVFENLGIIKKAEIELNGLTLLTGYNDSGKSFLSKAIFSIVKVLNEARQSHDIEKFEDVSSSVSQIHSLHRRFVPFTQEKMTKFNPRAVNLKVQETFLKEALSEEELEQIIDTYTNEVVNDLSEFRKPQPLFNERSSQVDKIIEEIKRVQLGIKSRLNKKLSPEKIYSNYFDKSIIQKLFQSQINSINKAENLDIKVTEGVSELLNIKVSNNQTTSFKVENLLLQKDAVIIETPTIVQLERFISYNLAYSPFTRQQQVELPPHYYDLSKKINYSNPNLASEFSVILDKTMNVIGGQLVYSQPDAGIVFVKKNGSKIRSNNIATGIKAIGLLQLLMNSGAINKDSILIVDEPEVHLHPQWEIEYAEILVQLQKVGITILISSHSPYFIEAILNLSEKYKLDGALSIYFAVKNEKDGTSSFVNSTENPDAIFKSLSKPMRDLFIQK